MRGQRRGLETRTGLDILLVAGVGALLLGRAGYVGIQHDYYIEHQHAVEALRVWRGGLLWDTALVGAVAGSALVCAFRDVGLLRVLDLLAPAGALLAVSAWLACLAVGCAWGIETSPGQGLLWSLSMDLPDLYGIRQPRVAVQLLGTAWSASVLGLLLLVHGRVRKHGVLFCIWLLLHGLGTLVLGFLRGDPVPMVAGWRVDQLADGALAAASAILLAVRMTPWGSQRRP